MDTLTLSVRKATLRFGIIGIGNIGKVHLKNFVDGKIPNGRLTAVCSSRMKEEELPEGVAMFRGIAEMLDSGLIDAVIVSTPHPLHREHGEMVLARGLHLMMEKPLASTKLDGERLLAFPRRPGQIFAVMMNLRTHPQIRRIKQLLDEGRIGTVQRVQWTITNWFRPEAYFSLSEWRATWRGEGGGVLINQALHNLDVLQWFFGMPRAVRAFCEFGRDHDIEVEDHVTAFLELPNGATGVFTAGTGEAPGVNRLEIAGTRGLLILEYDALKVVLNDVDIREFSRQSPDAFGAPETLVKQFANDQHFASHSGALENFVSAALNGDPVLAEAEEGLRSVELANAMLYSTWVNDRVVLPLDACAYQAELDRTIARCVPRVREVRTARVDMNRSYS